MATAELDIEAYIRELRKYGNPSRHTLTLVNSRYYATYLDKRHGYYIFNDQHLQRIVYEAIETPIRKKVPMIGENRIKALRYAAHKELKFLRSLTAELRPPKRAGEGQRQAHPGHWADAFTGNLVKSYWFEIDGKSTGENRAKRAAES